MWAFGRFPHKVVHDLYPPGNTPTKTKKIHDYTNILTNFRKLKVSKNQTFENSNFQKFQNVAPPKQNKRPYIPPRGPPHEVADLFSPRMASFCFSWDDHALRSEFSICRVAQTFKLSNGETFKLPKIQTFKNRTFKNPNFQQHKPSNFQKFKLSKIHIFKLSKTQTLKTSKF